MRNRTWRASRVMPETTSSHRAGDGHLPATGYDDITGVTTSNDVIYGLQGNDVLFGDAGNDYLFGGAGAGTVGGDGFDRAQYYVASTAVITDPARPPRTIPALPPATRTARSKSRCSRLSFGAACAGTNMPTRSGERPAAMACMAVVAPMSSTAGMAMTSWTAATATTCCSVERGADTLLGGEGVDRALSYSDATTGGVTADLAVAPSSTGIAAEGYLQFDQKIFMARTSTDSLRGDEIANSIWGANGNDIMYGRGGNDVLTGR